MVRGFCNIINHGLFHSPLSEKETLCSLTEQRYISGPAKAATAPLQFPAGAVCSNGGPDGGDGGRGGDLIFEVDEGLNTLSDYRHRRKYAAGDGEPGGKRRCHGKDGTDLVLHVPEGTVIKEASSGKVIADMSGDNRRQVVLKWRKRRTWQPAFCHSHHAGPEIRTARTAGPRAGSLSGAEGDRRRGTDRIPECRKSTLLSRVTNADPKIANYHFTTLTPEPGRGRPGRRERICHG